jgi:hypothetical protein
MTDDCGIGHGLVGAEMAMTDDCGIGHGLVGAEMAMTDDCGIGHGLVGAEMAMTDDCGIGHGLVGAARTIEAAETNKIAVKARRIEFFTGVPSFVRIITHD